MELTSPYPPHQLSSSYITINNPSPINHATKLHLSQIHLPLHRPIRRQRHPTPPQPLLKQLIKKKPTTTTTSDILHLMDALGFPIPRPMYISLLKECTQTRDASGALELHNHINRSGLKPGLMFSNRVLLMYVSCGLFDNARQVFDKMPIKDCNSWAAMIAGYIDDENYEEAINVFVDMQCRYPIEFPLSRIIVCILKACVEAMELGLGMQIHGWLLKVGFDVGSCLSSSLINLYGKFGCFEGVDFVFDHLDCRNTSVWTAKLVNIGREERFYEVLGVFKEMGRKGVKKNGFTFSSVLRACSRINDDGQCGQQVHANLIKLGLESNDFVQCGLVDMYAKCGFINYAKRVFERIGDKRTVACWNAMLRGYIQHGCCVEAIKVLYAMKSAGLQPQEPLLNEVRFTCGSTSFENETDGMCT